MAADIGRGRYLVGYSHNKNSTFGFYTVNAGGEAPIVPFDRFADFVENHKGTKCFILAKFCLEGDVRKWSADERVQVIHSSVIPEKEPEIDPLAFLFPDKLPQDKENYYIALLEVLVPLRPDEMREIYYSYRNEPAGLMVFSDRKIPDWAVSVFGELADPEKIDEYQEFLQTLFKEWVIFAYRAIVDEVLPGERPDYIYFPVEGSIGIEFVDWGVPYRSRFSEGT